MVGETNSIVWVAWDVWGVFCEERRVRSIQTVCRRSEAAWVTLVRDEA
jgi:hypothetical protein